MNHKHKMSNRNLEEQPQMNNVASKWNGVHKILQNQVNYKITKQVQN